MIRTVVQTVEIIGGSSAPRPVIHTPHPRPDRDPVRCSWGVCSGKEPLVVLQSQVQNYYLRTSPGDATFPQKSNGSESSLPVPLASWLGA